MPLSNPLILIHEQLTIHLPPTQFFTPLPRAISWRNPKLSSPNCPRYKQVHLKNSNSLARAIAGAFAERIETVFQSLHVFFRVQGIKIVRYNPSFWSVCVR